LTPKKLSSTRPISAEYLDLLRHCCCSQVKLRVLGDWWKGDSCGEHVLNRQSQNWPLSQ
jgi:hypothetical protein